MVSIRRRKNLGYSTGQDIASVNDVTVGNTEPVSEHPMPLDDLNLPPREVKYDAAGRDDAPVSDSKEDQINQSNEFGSTTTEEPTAGDVVKRRKQYHRRHPQEKHIRGVYLKNNKYQAAIKVDKEQVHLGTFSSQEEAARLYDRAAFMRGRKTNFELPEEEKQELKKTKWDEFLAMTRSAITSKSKKACR